MKLLFPAALCLLFAACASILPEPTPGTAEHQRWLHEQARENFLAMKAAQRAQRGLPPEPRVATSGQTPSAKVKPTPKPKSQTWLFAETKPAKLAKPQNTRRRSPARNDDTIYEPTAEGRAELREWETRKAREYQIYEAIEAKRLGKTPQTLTREERAWIRSRAD